MQTEAPEHAGLMSDTFGEVVTMPIKIIDSLI